MNISDIWKAFYEGPKGPKQWHNVVLRENGDIVTVSDNASHSWRGGIQLFNQEFTAFTERDRI